MRDLVSIIKFPAGGPLNCYELEDLESLVLKPGEKRYFQVGVTNPQSLLRIDQAFRSAALNAFASRDKFLKPNADSYVVCVVAANPVVQGQISLWNQVCKSAQELVPDTVQLPHSIVYDSQLKIGTCRASFLISYKCSLDLGPAERLIAYGTVLVLRA